LGFRFPFVWLHVTCMVIFGFNNGNHIHVSCYRLLARFRFAAPVHNISTSKVSFYGKYIHPRVLPPWLLTSNWFVLMKTKYPNICERKLTLYLRERPFNLKGGGGGGYGFFLKKYSDSQCC
jgi:hypothetical protein